MDFWDYDYICMRGKRDTNQDRVLITDNIIFVLDGHGDQQNSKALHVVDLAVKYLPGILEDKIRLLAPNTDPNMIIDVIKSCCLDVDKYIYQKYQNVMGGTTLTGIISIQEKIFIVNIGDSETVIVNGIIPIFITKKHKPTDEDESERITDRGHFVAHKRVNGNLDVSRVIGDYEYGKINLDGSFNEKSPVWAMPDVTYLAERYTDIFIYSDGFGDHVDLSSLITVAFTNENDTQREDSMSVKLANIVRKISHDNITVISVRPKKNGFIEKIED